LAARNCGPPLFSGAGLPIFSLLNDRTSNREVRTIPGVFACAFPAFTVEAEPQLSPADRLQRRNRERLRAAMEVEGFSNYELEWRHYTLEPEPTPDTLYDVPVR
jgi:D-alanyl-D-alanine dipeptidase